MILSRKPYAGWREIQEEYGAYMTSLGPFTEEALLDYLARAYGQEDAGWGFTREEVRGFMRSDATVLEARHGDT